MLRKVYLGLGVEPRRGGLLPHILLLCVCVCVCVCVGIRTTIRKPMFAYWDCP
jgi:hypothetical protein